MVQPEDTNTEAASSIDLLREGSRGPSRNSRTIPIRIPFTAGLEAPSRKLGRSLRLQVESLKSWGDITSMARAISPTLLPKGPIWSREEAKATSPHRLTIP